MEREAARRLPRLLQALAEEAATHRFERKVLVCRRTGVGRELLRALSAAGVPWVNFEVATPLRLAHQLVGADIAAAGLRIADEFDELAHFDAAMDTVLAGSTGRLAELAQSVGLRQAIARGVQSLRLAGISAQDLADARFRDEAKREHIMRILDAYETRLHDAGLLDSAAVLARAAMALHEGTHMRALDGRVLIAPDVVMRGRPGEIVAALIRGGARTLPADAVRGLERPAALVHADTAVAASPLSWLHDIGGWQVPAVELDEVVLDVFAASSVTAELREVLRRVVAGGLQWDEVEIVATDAMAYGVALDGLARRLDIPVSYAAGLPVARTRPGRAVAGYLDWLQLGMPADLLRQMFERGDIAHPAVSGTALARRLRSLRIGRGRDRYRALLQKRLQALAVPADAEDERTTEERASDNERQRQEFEALSAVLLPLLDATPADLQHVSAADLATSLLVLLRALQPADAADATAKVRLVQRLERIASAVERPTTLAAAAAVLLTRLEDRVPSPQMEGASPWTAAGGHLHLSDLEHGGYACRRATFVVGLDAGRFPGVTTGDALLVDEDRRRLDASGARLATSLERLAEKRYRFAAMAARLRGRITFSYATWDAAESRSVAPASELLQAYRLLSGDINADYEALHEAVAPAASAVPRGSALLDAADVWLHVLASGGSGDNGRRALRRGVKQVCAAYPQLGAGVQAFRARRRAMEAGPQHGVIVPRAGLDPRLASPPQAVSPTALQTLGACPHRYLLRYVLRVRPPEDSEYSPDQWLRANERGALLHAVFEETLKAAQLHGIDYNDDAFADLALGTLRQRSAALRESIPPPGRAVEDAELEALREDVLAFIAMVREHAPRPLAMELVFGRDGKPPVPVALPDGSTLLLSGAIDRVDELDDGSLAIIDYKTGSSAQFQGRDRPFSGGRRLQHVLYAAAAERLFDRRVSRAEFHFPSRRSENFRARFDARALQGGLDVVVDLLSMVRNGWFVPTNVADDCRWCDYAAACRVTVSAYGRVDSPIAEWARHVDDDALDVLRRLRR
jgi:ATP-dependent helicase/nuclease subunit B